MKLPGVVGIGFFMIAAGTRVAADVSVSNDGLRATYEEPSRRLILAPRTSGASFAACDHFAPVDATVNAVTVNDKTFGKGKGLEVVHTNGQRDQVLLFPNKPFFFFRTTLKNGNAQTVTNRVAFQALTLNLGLPSSALNTLGTGGLLKPDKNPGSYMWTAVADPASRRGAVAGWVTTDRGSGIVRMDVTHDVIRLLPHVDYGRLLLAPSQSTTLETFAVGFFDDVRLGLETYADTIAEIYAIRLPPHADRPLHVVCGRRFARKRIDRPHRLCRADA